VIPRIAFGAITPINPADANPEVNEVCNKGLGTIIGMMLVPTPRVPTSTVSTFDWTVKYWHTPIAIPSENIGTPVPKFPVAAKLGTRNPDDSAGGLRGIRADFER
jgi:hypothetical protein